MNMNLFKVLDDLFALNRGNYLAQEKLLRNNILTGIQPDTFAFDSYVMEFGLDAWVISDVAQHILQSLLRLATGDTIYSPKHSFHYASGKKPISLSNGYASGATVYISGKAIGFAQNIAYSADQSRYDAPKGPCQHERVEMITSAFCKKCNASL